MSRGPGKAFKACSRCRLLVPHEVETCPSCGSTTFTDTWSGVVIVIDPERSRLAKLMGISKPGRYAIKLGM
ncbi:MAG: transcription elongation factor subunit Spt4 [Sulfolobales archaeon]|nr:DNA-directed RNA polymerase, subunit E'' [Sulfolobales archaeon]MCX8208485.1 DNA-directed RNA polymerase, subunit E'' [Sulfolobales archaeon]MDW8010036.1 transcription elongation factor subunit Spt4 [Sulfolobales archaeon]